MIGSSLARRVGLVGMVALLVSVLPLAMAQAQPDPTPDQDSYVDLDADTNVGYSVRWSQFTFESADEVLIGREDLFPDNLASGSLQGQGDGRPLLLTPSDALAQEVTDEIARLGATTVHILGGEEAISGPVEDELEGLVDNVERHFGETRIETAIAISELVPSDTVIVARAFANDDPTQAFADSLAAGAWAADAGFPILLTQTEVLTENTATALADGGYTNAFVVGGEAAIDSTTFDAIDEIVDNVERVGGANRFETAVLIANERGFDSADDAEVTVLTDGQGGAAWADGFSAAAFAALHDAPLVLSNSASADLPPETVAFLSGNGAASFAQDAVANELDPDVGLVCGPSVPDGVDDDDDPSTPSDNDDDDPTTPDDNDQCAQAAALRGLTNRVDVGEPSAVEIDPTTVVAGDDITITIPGLDEGDEVVISGCGLEGDDNTFTVGDEGAELDEDGNVVITVTIAEDQEAGDCELSITVDGEELGPFDITVTPRPTNQDFTVTPQEAATNQVSTVGGNEGARQYSVSGLADGNYDIALFPCGEVDVADNGETTFGDDEGTAGQADDIGTTDTNSIVIEVVNGAATVGGPRYVNNVSPVNGTITFTIDSTASDCGVPVVFQDANNNNQLDLGEDDTPVDAEGFGVGGQKSYIPAEAASGAPTADETILLVDKDADFFVTDGGVGPDVTYFYDGNDVFQIFNTGTSTCVQVTQQVFEQNLSSGDVLDASSNYNADPAFSSTFCIEDTAPAAPTGLTATPVDNDTIQLAWNDVPGADSYNVYRAQDPTQQPPPGPPVDDCATLTAAQYTLIATVPGTQEQYTDNGLAPSTEYCYQVTAVDDGDESARSNTAHAETTAGPEAVRPQSQDAELTTSGGFANRLDAGDVLTACFNEALRAPDAGDAVELTDADGDVTTLTNGGNATFALGAANSTVVSTGGDTNPETCPANQTLVITVTGAVTDQNAGGDGVVNVPIEATDSSGVTDLAGNEWDIANSLDTLFDLDPGTGNDAE